MTRRIVLILSLLVLVGAGMYYWPVSSGVSLGDGDSDAPVVPKKERAKPTATATAPSQTTAAAVTVAPAAALPQMNPETDFPIVAPLNAPGSTVARDLDVVRQLFDAWQSNFPREGNPVGENAEITAALMGQNRLGLALIPKGHRAVNERGELCDRFGTPYRFHQISGTRMEIRSAGPDRKFATEDDAIWTPQ